jgi:quinolinate synthase
MPIDAKTEKETLSLMIERLSHVVPELELRKKAPLVFKINELKKKRGAVILGHNYMEPALFHTVADIVGDSLELSRKAAESKADPIVFCGVRFMAETAKILNPSRMVLLPARVAGCSLAASITAQDVRNLKKQYPGVPVVTYINSYADVKAETDVCVTSGNASKIVSMLDSDSVIFIPDEYLAQNVARETGKKIIFPKVTGNPTNDDTPVMIGWRGKCEVHDQFTVDDIKQAREQFPDVAILAHPECPPEVVELADFSGSTSKMIQHVKNTKASKYLLLTECSMGDNIAAENPDKEMVRMCSVRCPHMNEITLEDTLRALEQNVEEIFVPEDIQTRARRSVERMLEMSA